MDTVKIGIIGAGLRSIGIIQAGNQWLWPLLMFQWKD